MERKARERKTIYQDSNHLRNGGFRSVPLKEHFRSWNYAAALRRVSISSSHAMIWFQFGMLWDAKTLQFVSSEIAKQLRKFCLESVVIFPVREVRNVILAQLDG